jgi:uncharacterized protein YpbB
MKELTSEKTARHSSNARQSDRVRDFSEAEKVALIILHALKQLRREVGRSRLVEILNGSCAKEIFEHRWNEAKSYGRLQNYTQSQCFDFIDQLLKMRYLTLVGADYPVLDLTSKGTAALQNLESIPLNLKISPTPAPKGSPLRQISQMPGTVQQTLSLFRRGLSPQEIADHRGMSETTVFGHFEELIGRSLVQVSAIVPADKVKKIREVIREVGVLTTQEVKDRLPDGFSDDEIRCVVSDEMRRAAGSKNVQGSDGRDPVAESEIQIINYAK